MRHRISLPSTLPASFAVKDAAALGIGKWRSSTPDLHRPFRGVRSANPPESFRAVVDCYLPRMKPRHRFIGRSAMRLWGIPHPRRWRSGELLEIAVPRDATPPKIAGIKARRLNEDRARTWRVGGAHVVDPVAAVFSCAGELTLDQAVKALDALLSGSTSYPKRVHGFPLLTRDDITTRLAEWRRFPGRATIQEALEFARENVESPKETETRLLIMRSGLPEPTVQHEVFDDDRLVARIDLAYPELKIAIEYEGDGHRTDRDQWRRDIQRQRDLEDRGWIVIRLTQADLAGGSAALIARLRRAIASRG